MSQATLGSGPYRNSSLFSGYYLDERVADLDAWDCDEEAEEALEQIRDLWNQEGTLLPSYKEDELIDTWIAEILDILGYGSSSEVTLPDGGGYVDRLLFESEETRRESAKQALDSGTEGHFSRALSILEAKQWDADFEKFFSEQRSYRDASHQIKYYLERTPGDLNWGILTDGKKWRLYGTKDYETQTYYEVNLPEILESGNLEAFKYFYVFFRPGAFVETAGSSFLDDVWSESETAAQELGEDLQDNVFRALRVLGKGFVESNNLEIDPDDKDGLSADELKEQSLVLLYRLMFVLYAESRGLIDPDDPAASEEYQEYFSLEAKREEIIDEVNGLDVESGAAFDREFSGYSSSIWGRLTELFELIDEGEEDLDIPPYNGGLFSREDHGFLDEYEVKDPYIAEVIFWLSTTENDEGEHVPADYADLDTRHLGSIYEGLLEHEFRIAGPEGVAAVSEDGGQVWKSGDEVSVSDAVEVVDEGGLYVVNDEGERKATGAYYTPDYVVTYIVEETIDPLVDEIRDDLREEGYEPGTVEYAGELFQRVQNLSVLDPAMGSGHFLTKATGYLSKQVMDEVRALDEQAGFLDEQFIRREISKEVIYGVDINEMAVELSKLSMWLETLAADQPLAFLDHHMKAGNSLVGSDITEVLSEDGGDDDGGQLTLTQALARVRQETLEHVMELMSDLLAFDNDTLESVKSMEELYSEIREDPLYQRLFELANVHTAEEFGCDVPEDAYEQMAGAIEDEDDWAEIKETDWFKPAQATAAEQDFFHWELEFPAVFFDLDGEKLAGAGFDAVVGNPPWVNAWQMTESDTGGTLRNGIEGTNPFPEVLEGHWDLYIPFLLKSYDLVRNEGYLSFIIPNAFSREKYAEPVRDLFLRQSDIKSVAPSGDVNVFSGVSRQTIIPVILKTETAVESTSISIDEDFIPTRKRNLNPKTVDQSTFYETPGHQIRYGSGIKELELLQDIDDKCLRMGNICYVNYGAQISSKEKGGFGKAHFLSETYEEGHKKFFEGKNISRYHIEWPETYLDYQPSEIYGPRHPKLFESEKIAVRYVSADDDSILAAFDEDGMYTDHLTVLCTKYENVEGTDLRTNFEGFDKLDTGYSLKAILAIINSSVDNFYYANRFATGSLQGDYSHVYPQSVRKFPLPKVDLKTGDNDVEDQKLAEIVSSKEPNQKLISSYLIEDGVVQTSIAHRCLEIACDYLIEKNNELVELNLDIRDHFGNYEVKKPFNNIGFIQPPKEANESILEQTTKKYPSLRIGGVLINRESPNTVLIKATARYKPDDEDAYDTDQWGYTETDYLPAFRITDLTETEADLIEHFVPVAVDEAGGFANFRETATKTNSLVDRLKAIELPDVDDVADNLENYLRTVERAEELDEKIAKTDDLIDEIVYELYGLTAEEIEIVEETTTE